MKKIKLEKRTIFNNFVFLSRSRRQRPVQMYGLFSWISVWHWRLVWGHFASRLASGTTVRANIALRGAKFGTILVLRRKTVYINDKTPLAPPVARSFVSRTQKLHFAGNVWRMCVCYATLPVSLEVFVYNLKSYITRGGYDPRVLYGLILMTIPVREKQVK